MINKFIQKSILNNFIKYSFSADHHGPTPTKLEKVPSTLVYLYVKNADSVYEKVPAQVGQSLLDALTRSKVRGFQSNICHGYDFTYQPHIRPHDPFSDGPQCGGCRVVFEDNWYNRVDKETDGMSEQEKTLLTVLNIEQKQNQRLACCIPIQQWMNGMTLAMDPVPQNGGIRELF